MQFSKLRLAGFKSFVQPTEMFIEAGLTGVVGPNGCGKSNLVEALRWVMGETSAKGLRGGEMDDVIFAGTASRPAHDLAEVVLELRGAAASLPWVDDDGTLELCRRIGRGAGSAYRLNGREVRGRDVQLLFADATSGARSAAIVSQGQIGALVEAKPTDRRRLLEDAAGVAGLQSRRHEAELKLQAAEANLARVEDTLATLGEQRDRLRKQARQARRYRDLSAEIRSAEAALLGGRWVAARAALEAAGQTVGEARARLEAAAAALAEARAERDRCSRAVDEQRRLEAALAAELAREGERVQAAASRITQQSQQRATLAERAAQVERDGEDAQAALRDAEATIARLEDERRILERHKEEGGRALAAAEAAAGAARGASEAAEMELRRALAEVAGLEARVEHERERAAAMERERAALETAEAQARERLAALAPQPDGEQGGTAATAEGRLGAALAAVREAEGALDAAAHSRESCRARRIEAERGLLELRERQREIAARRARETERARELEERLADGERRRARLAERLAELDGKAEQARHKRADLRLVALETAADQAARAAEAAAAALATAQAARDEAAAVRDGAVADAEAARARRHEVEVELRALADLDEAPSAFSGVVDRIEVADGYADALAAALGDDLLASLDPAAPSHWRGDLHTPAAPLPRLPPACRPLAEVVAAPPELARRLAQVGIAAEEVAPVLQAGLAPGQRLVDVSGALWRWDGLVRRPDGNRRAAARLRQIARRRELEASLADWIASEAAAVGARDEADARLAGLADAAERAQRVHQAAAAALEAARAQASAARAADGALAAELAALEDERARLDAELGDLDGGARALGEQLREVGGGLAGTGEIAAAEAALADAEARLAVISAESEGAEAAHAAARDALAQAREEVAEAEAEVERVRRAGEALLAAARERAQERLLIESELTRLAELRERLMAEAAAAAGAAGEAAAALQRARSSLAVVEAGAEQARARRAETGAALARLHERIAEADARGSALAQELALWRERAAASEARQVELAARARAVAEEQATLPAPEALSREEEDLRRVLAGLEQRMAQAAAARTAAEARLAEAERRLEAAEAERLEAAECRARAESELARASDACAEAERAWRERAPAGPAEIPTEPPDPARLAAIEERLAALLASRDRLGPVNLRAVDELAELEMQIQTLEGELAELAGAIERLRRAITVLNREGRERLRAAFAQVERHFEALFVRLFGGGQARLALTDIDDPLAAGLELAASPPGKKLQSVNLLSGGEKALTALALIFAVFLTRPSPLCVLDEVDAPLDDANVGRFGALIEELAASTATRFLVITHHPSTMARMDRLYGVTMLEKGVSQLVSVDLQAAVALRRTA